MHEKFMKIAINLAKKAQMLDEVPIGAVVVKDGKVISKGYNKKRKYNNPLFHAEVVAIDKAIKKLGDWHLTDCTLYTTLEPCPMCAGYILNSRIKSVVFGASDQKMGVCGTLYNLLCDKRFNHRCEVVSGCLADVCGKLLTDYFKQKR